MKKLLSPTIEQSNADILTVVGECVAKLRTLRGLSQAELAKAANLQRTYVSDIERGLRNVTILTWHSIAEALSAEPAELLREAYAMREVRKRRATSSRSRK